MSSINQYLLQERLFLSLIFPGYKSGYVKRKDVWDHKHYKFQKKFGLQTHAPVFIETRYYCKEYVVPLPTCNMVNANIRRFESAENVSDIALIVDNE